VLQETVQAQAAELKKKADDEAEAAAAVEQAKQDAITQVYSSHCTRILTLIHADSRCFHPDQRCFDAVLTLINPILTLIQEQRQQTEAADKEAAAAQALADAKSEAEAAQQAAEAEESARIASFAAAKQKADSHPPHPHAGS